MSELVIASIGASAGGLEALCALLDAMPSTPGLALVVVTHQQPGRSSLLPELLQRHTEMPVELAGDATRLRPDRVYVTPPGKRLSFEGDVLRLQQDADTVPSLPIDASLRALAEAKGPYAIGVVMSGTGSDGTFGLEAIKAEGGMTMAQTAESAAYPGMPRSAEIAGVVDHVAAPSEMPALLMRYGQQLTQRARAGDELGDVEHALVRVVSLLRTRHGHDFSQYKPSTLRRRIRRRMSVLGDPGPTEYVQRLEGDAAEIDLLFRELLIGVTSFFRDPEAFEVLAARALPPMLADKRDGDPVRVWVPGCSTGEEAYSVAIVLQETMERLGRHLETQVFATDVDPRAVDSARAGRYAEGIAEHVRPERLERFFTAEDGHYRVSKPLRETLVFAVQNLIQDPPFTRLDLLVCRNVLIYFDAPLQRRLLPLFQYALRPGGVLFLGSSEALGARSDAFEIIDRKWKIFRRRAGVSAADHVHGYRPSFALRSATAELAMPTARAKSAEQLATSALLTLLSPTVLVDTQGDIVHVHGRTGRYLEPSPGGPRMNVLAMAREGLSLPLGSAIREASQKDEEVVRSGVQFHPPGWRRDDAPTSVRLRVRRVSDPEALRGLVAITFEPEPTSALDEAPAEDEQWTPRERQLEQELAHSRENIQSTFEELETTNEELKSANEELQSTNEELQSTNEELETSREEMHSLNEELQTVNQELEAKLDELSRINDDMRNLLDATKIATIFLDRALRIQRYTPAATRVVNLIETDVGRPLGDLVAKLDYGELVEDAQATLRELSPRAREVRGTDGVWYLARMGPYQTIDNVVNGIVLTFVDITAVKEAQREVGWARSLAETTVGLMREPFVIVDADRRILQANAAFATMVGEQVEQVLGKIIDELGPGLEALRAPLARRAGGGPQPESLTLERPLPEGGSERREVSVRDVPRDEEERHFVLAFHLREEADEPGS